MEEEEVNVGMSAGRQSTQGVHGRGVEEEEE